MAGRKFHDAYHEDNTGRQTNAWLNLYIGLRQMLPKVETQVDNNTTAQATSRGRLRKVYNGVIYWGMGGQSSRLVDTVSQKARKKPPSLL